VLVSVEVARGSRRHDWGSGIRIALESRQILVGEKGGEREMRKGASGYFWRLGQWTIAASRGARAPALIKKEMGKKSVIPSW